MKTIIASLLLSLVFTAKAAELPRIDFMTIEAQEKYVENVAKEIRRDLWVRGYEDVESQVTFMNKARIYEHIKDSDSYEQRLNKDEISELYKCEYKKTCEVYLVSVSSSYYSGYGVEAHFVLLNTAEQTNTQISYVLYAE